MLWVSFKSGRRPNAHESQVDVSTTTWSVRAVSFLYDALCDRVPQGSGCDAAVGASASELAQLRLGGGRAGGVNLFLAFAALGGTVDEDAMRSVVIGAALGLQVKLIA